MEHLFEKSCQYAINCHSGQKRKDGTIYILHPIEVTSIASTMTSDEEVLSSAMLHDVVEDCNIDIEEIVNLFGARVGKIVALETEPKYSDLSKSESWKLRKEEALTRLKVADDIGFKIVFLADKLANIRSIYREFQKKGIDSFNMFNVHDVNEHAWYYFNVLENVSELKETDAYNEYEMKINLIFNNLKKEEVINGKRNNII